MTPAEAGSNGVGLSWLKYNPAMTIPRPLQAVATAALPPANTPLATALNALLARQPQARAHLQRHVGKTLRLALPLLDLRLQLDESMQFMPAAATSPPADAEALTLTPDMAALPRWVTGAPLAELFRVQGDGLYAADLGHALADFDLVLALRPWLGDIAASRAAQFVQALHTWRTRAVQSLGRNLAEYAVHEQALLAEPFAVHTFIADVDHLREDTDRLEARLWQLENRQVP